MFKSVLVIAGLLFVADMCNGIMDAIAFHYADSLPGRKGWSERFWDPSMSWMNKYATDENGRLIKPLSPKYWGSTTFFAWTTDAWHLFKSLYRGLLRAAVVVLIVFAARTWQVRISWFYGIAIWLFIALFQAMGFHLTYSVIF